MKRKPCEFTSGVKMDDQGWGGLGTLRADFCDYPLERANDELNID